VLRLLQVADEPEREWLTERLTAGRTVTTDDDAELVRLFSKYNVGDWASAQVRTLAGQILASIDAADVGDAKKVVLSEWVALQFTSGLDSVSDHSPTRVGRLVGAVAELTDRL
jgi:hypothetical protein